MCILLAKCTEISATQRRNEKLQEIAELREKRQDHIGMFMLFSKTSYLLFCYSFPPNSFFLLFCSWIAHGVPLCWRWASINPGIYQFLLFSLDSLGTVGVLIQHFPFVTTETYLTFQRPCTVGWNTRLQIIFISISEIGRFLVYQKLSILRLSIVGCPMSKARVLGQSVGHLIEFALDKSPWHLNT